MNLKFWKKKPLYSVVEFNIDSDSRFALRNNLNNEYHDATDHRSPWWSKRENVISYCLTTKEEACKLLQIYSEPKVVDCGDCKHES